MYTMASRGCFRQKAEPKAPTMTPRDPSQTIRELNQRLRQLEQAHQGGAASGEVFSTGIEALDRLFPASGLPAGVLVEFLSEGEGSGAGTLALAIVSSLLGHEGMFVVIDQAKEFYPPAMVALGIDLKRVIVTRPANARDAMWAFEQSLSCVGVRAALCWIDRLDDRLFRRLQLAAELGRGIGFLVRPAAARELPSWAEARLLVQGLPTPPQRTGRKLRVELLRCRKGAGGKAVELDISHETSRLRLAASVAPPTSAKRAARA